MRLKIIKWEKYNPRSELKSMPWLRVQNTIVFSRKLFGMNPSQKWFWICLLAFAAQQNSDEFEIDLPWAEHETGVTQKDMFEAIKHFQEKGLLTIIEHADGTDAVHERYTNGTDTIESVSNGRNGTDVTERNEQNETKEVPSNPSASTDLSSGPDYELAQKWFAMAKEEAGWREFKIETFVSGISKIKRNLNLTNDGVSRVFDFIKQDDFWRPNCLSPSSMFKKSKSNDLRKIDNVLIAFKKKTEKYDKAMKAADDIATGKYKGWDE